MSNKSPPNQNFDVIIIGGGIGGYICAIRSSQLKQRVALIETSATFGGTCINIGCIPSKALLDSSHKYYEVKSQLQDHGIECDSVRLDVAKMINRKQRVVDELTTGLSFLMKKNGIETFQGNGTIVDTIQKEAAQESKVVVEISASSEEVPKNREAKHTITGKACVLATGSIPISLPNIPIDNERVILSDQALSLTSVPSDLTILGGGVIALELGSVWSRLGAKVTLIEKESDILLGLDPDQRQVAKRIFKAQGLDLMLQHECVGIEKDKEKEQVKMTLLNHQSGKDNKQEIQWSTSKLLVAVGRQARPQEKKHLQLGLKLDQRGFVERDQQSYKTNLAGVYAIGDCCAGPMLAHRAQDEGIALAERLAGKYGKVNQATIPWVIYTWPEIAWVGENEQQLQGREINTGSCLLSANGRSKALGSTAGRIKIITDKKSDQVLGFSIIGAMASELIAEIVVLLEFGGSGEDLARTIHAHPTVSEAVREAALSSLGRGLHS